MIMFEKFLFFYAMAGFVVGGFVACMDTVNFNIRGRPMPWPRLWAGVAAGVLWPLVLWKMVLGR